MLEIIPLKVDSFLALSGTFWQKGTIKLWAV